MKTINDKTLQESASEDIEELEKKRMEEVSDYISNTTNRMIDYTIDYIKDKFELR